MISKIWFDYQISQRHVKPINAWYPSSQTSLFCNSEIRWSRKLSRCLVFLGFRLPNGLIKDSKLWVKRYKIWDRSRSWNHRKMKHKLDRLLQSDLSLITPSFNPLTCYTNFLSRWKWSIINIWQFMIFICEYWVVWFILYSATQPVNYSVRNIRQRTSWILKKKLIYCFWQNKTFQQ